MSPDSAWPARGRDLSARRAHQAPAALRTRGSRDGVRRWLLDPRDIELAVEVITPSEKSRAIADKNDWYALAGVATLLVIDPRHGTWALHTRPEGGSYQDVLPGKFVRGPGAPVGVSRRSGGAGGLN
ncbi:Uma2 family endonuclease [Actinomycetota bacterium Odt1-20B]